MFQFKQCIIFLYVNFFLLGFDLTAQDKDQVDHESDPTLGLEVSIATTESEVRIDSGSGRNGLDNHAQDSNLAQRVKALHEKLESAQAVQGKGFLRRRLSEIAAKFNWVHLIRVARREIQADSGEVSGIPSQIFVLNTVGPLIGVHVAESTIIGPSMIAVGRSGLLPSTASSALMFWGASLMNPFPTGTPIDWLTETFCYVTAAIVATPTYQRNMYRFETFILSGASKVSTAIGLQKLLSRFIKKQSALDQLKIIAGQSSDDSGYKISMETRQAEKAEVTVAFTFNDHSPLLRINLQQTEAGSLKLSRFTRYEENLNGHWHFLRKALGRFGTDVKDAILKPEQLIAGGHGEESFESVDERDKGRTYIVRGTSVMMGHSFKLHRKPKDQVCRNSFSFQNDYDFLGSE